MGQIIAASEQARVRVKEQRRAARQAKLETKGEIASGKIVEIAGSAKVDVSDAWGREKTDHQGALAVVEGHTFSPKHGRTVALVRTGDNQARLIPEDRLRETGTRLERGAGSEKRVVEERPVGVNRSNRRTSIVSGWGESKLVKLANGGRGGRI